MAGLEIEFNCMCLFVPDEDAGTVHVLMPATDHHPHHGGNDHQDGHAQGSAIPKHVVKMLHPSFTGQKKGRPMEGWALALGAQPGSATTRIAPPDPSQNGAKVVDLTDLTGGRRIERRLVEDVVTPEVASRVTLHAGKVTSVDAEAIWRFKGQNILMAHQVTWKIEELPEDLRWIRLGAGGNPPLASLSELAPESDGSFRLRIFHVTEDALPPTGVGALNPVQVGRHFGVFYRLLGITDPGEDLLPQIVSPPSGGVNPASKTMKPPFDGFTVNCGAARASL